MTTRYDTPRTPQTQPRPVQSETHDAAGHVRGVQATSGGLIRSTLMASGAAAALLAVVYLPAEYGIDPTGFGAVLGLTEMGQIKQQLYAEAAADEAAAAAPVTLDPTTQERLDRIEAKLDMIAAVIGAPPALTEAPAQTPKPVAADPAPAAEPAPAPETSLDVAAAPSTAEATSVWRDEVSYILAPGEGIEVKLAMQEGQTVRFEWTANGSVVNFDTHGDGSGQKISYEKGRGVPGQAGELTAAFTGNHGWFWRNRTDAPLTVTLRTAGDYAELRAP